MKNSEWFYNAFVERWGNLTQYQAVDSWMRWADECDLETLKAAVSILYGDQGDKRPNLLAMKHAYRRAGQLAAQRRAPKAPKPGIIAFCRCNGTGKVWIAQGRNHPREPWRFIHKKDVSRRHFDETRSMPHPCQCVNGRRQNDIIYPKEGGGFGGIADQLRTVEIGWNNCFQSSHDADKFRAQFKQGVKG